MGEKWGLADKKRGSLVFMAPSQIATYLDTMAGDSLSNPSEGCEAGIIPMTILQHF